MERATGVDLLSITNICTIPRIKLHSVLKTETSRIMSHVIGTLKNLLIQTDLKI